MSPAEISAARRLYWSLRRELWESDRGNSYFQNRLAFTLARVGETQVLAGRHRLAGPLLHESIERARATPEEYGTSSIIAKAYLLLGDIELVSGGDPCSWYGRMADLLPRVRAADLSSQVIALRDRALEYLKSCAD